MSNPVHTAVWTRELGRHIVLLLSYEYVLIVPKVPARREDSACHSPKKALWGYNDLMAHTNPYQPTTPSTSLSANGSSPIPRWKLAFWLAAYSYPVIGFCGFYLSWLVAWLVLGHKPRIALDDPKSIGGLMDIAYLISVVAFLSVPVLTPIGFIASFVCPLRLFGSPRTRGAILATAYIGICVAIFLTIQADPGSIVEWWLD